MFLVPRPCTAWSPVVVLTSRLKIEVSEALCLGGFSLARLGGEQRGKTSQKL